MQSAQKGIAWGGEADPMEGAVPFPFPSPCPRTLMLGCTTFTPDVWSLSENVLE